MSFQPVPTYAELSESYTDPKTNVTKSAFNPVWLSWFLSLSETTGNAVGLAFNASLGTNEVVLGDGANTVTAVTGNGNVNDVLTSQGAGYPPVWQPTSFVNPLTTKGDIVYENAVPAPAALAIGTTGQTLSVVAGLPAWTRPGVDTTYSYQTPTTGFSITIGNGVYTLILDPAGALLAGTIVLPAAPVDGQVVRISSTQTITTLTISPSAGQTVKNAPTGFTVNLTGDQGYAFIYRATGLTWFRLQ